MGMVQEVAPGVFREGGKLFLCPACGMAVAGGDPMNEEDVFLWFTATLYALHKLGAQGCDPSQAGSLARQWVHEGGHKRHAEGGHNVKAE